VHVHRAGEPLARSRRRLDVVPGDLHRFASCSSSACFSTGVSSPAHAKGSPNMRATVMYGAGDVRVETVPDPGLVDPTDALVRVTLACVCGSDLWPYKTLERTNTGRPVGHEAIGVVEKVGAQVRTLKTGDVVVMPFAYSDGTCLFCHEHLQTS